MTQSSGWAEAVRGSWRNGLTSGGAQLAAADPGDIRALILEWASSTQLDAADDMTLVLVGDDLQARCAR